MKELTFALMVIVGVLLIYLSFVTGVGLFIYSWMKGMTVAAAAWKGFVTFVSMYAGGWLLNIIGVTGALSSK